MGSFLRRSATSRLEEGELTWLAWTSATDAQDGDLGQARATNSDDEDDTSTAQRRDPVAENVDRLNFEMHGALPAEGPPRRRPVDDFYTLSNTETRSSIANVLGVDHPGTDNGDTNPLLPCRSMFLEHDLLEEDGSFEPVGDLPGLRKLDFKPLILRSWVLITVLTFYAGVIAGLATLYWYGNAATVFHVHATASRFTIRYLPSVIGTLSTIIFSSIFQNYARIRPYIIMAAPTGLRQTCANARFTVLAPNFPMPDIMRFVTSQEWMLLAMMATNLYLAPFVTPFKTILILRKVSATDPNKWTITISGTAAPPLMVLFTCLAVLVVIVLIRLWNQRTGLKWDPVSLADHMMLWQGSDALDDFSGLEYSLNHLRENFGSRNSRFKSLEARQYRLGYWRHKRTNKYWHGIRRWPRSPDRQQSEELEIRSEKWWKQECQAVLDHPDRCYRHTYLWLSGFPSYAVFAVVVLLVSGGIWVNVTGRIPDGFTLHAEDFVAANTLVRFVPTFLLGLLGVYWYQMDLWYRQLQPFVGMRRPQPASENLLLGYPCALPVVVTLQALGAAHWRVALASTMPLVQKLLLILAGSAFTVELGEYGLYDRVSISARAFNAGLGIICSYTVLMLFLWPGLDRRLPIIPRCIADYTLVFYGSSLMRNEVFLPHNMNEERWHMKYRLRLQERLYGFGFLPGENSSIHLGIDDIFARNDAGERLRFVVPLVPPERLHRRLLRRFWRWSATKLNIKRRPTFEAEEIDAMQRLRTHLGVGTGYLPLEEEHTAAFREEHDEHEQDLRAITPDGREGVET